MLCDASSRNQAEHHCFPQSLSALNWPIELDIWRIESQTQISSCQKRLIQTGGSKTLVFFPPLTLHSFSVVWWEKWLLISPAVPSGRCQELQWTAFHFPRSLKSFFWRCFLALWLIRWPRGESGKTGLCLCIKFNLYNTVGRVSPMSDAESPFLLWFLLRGSTGKYEWDIITI